MPETADTARPLPDRERAIRAIKILLFSASLVPAAVGGAIAAHAGAFAWPPFAFAALGLFVGQAAGDHLYYYLTHFHTDPRDAHTRIFAGWRPLFTGTRLRPAVRLNCRGFGETSLFFAFGPMITFGVYYVLVRQPARVRSRSRR